MLIYENKCIFNCNVSSHEIDVHFITMCKNVYCPILLYLPLFTFLELLINYVSLVPIFFITITSISLNKISFICFYNEGSKGFQKEFLLNPQLLQMYILLEVHIYIMNNTIAQYCSEQKEGCFLLFILTNMLPRISLFKSALSSLAFKSCFLCQISTNISDICHHLNQVSCSLSR